MITIVLLLFLIFISYNVKYSDKISVNKYFKISTQALILNLFLS